MFFVDSDETPSVLEENALTASRRILADITSHDDNSVYKAAMHVASCGATQSERERALAFTALLSDVIEGA